MALLDPLNVLRVDGNALLVLETSKTSETPSAEHRLVLVPTGARGGEHALASEDSVGSSHERLDVSTAQV